MKRWVSEVNSSPFSLARLDNLVIDVGNVADISKIVTFMSEIPSYRIKYHHHSGMTDVAVIVDSHAAHIHADLTRYAGLELFFFAG